MSGNQTFRELLSQPTDQVERPRPLAPGHYYGEIKSHELGTSRQKQTPYVRFILVPTEETTDVAEGANNGMTLSNTELPLTLYITPKSLYRISDFLDAVLGKETGRSFDERIPETRGVRVMMQVSTRDVTDENGVVTATYNDIGAVVKV